MATDQIAEQVAGIVSRAIVAAGKTKKQIAEATGIPYTTLGRKLLGTTEFTFTELKMIADALGVAPSTFTPPAFARTVTVTSAAA